MDNFLKDLFDLSFSRFVTPTLARIIYLLIIVCSGISHVTFLTMAATAGIGAGLTAGALATVSFMGTVIFARVFIESSLALFQIARYAAEIARRGRPNHDSQRLD